MGILVSFFVVALGFFIFLGSFGGVVYLGDYARALISDRKLRSHSRMPSCRGCTSYEVCVEVMGDELPASPCAYWTKKGAD